MNGAFDLLSGIRFATAGGEVGGGVDFDHVAILIFDDVLVSDDATILKTHAATGFEATEFRGRNLRKIVLLNVNLAGKSNGARALGFVLGVVGGGGDVFFTFGQVGKDKLERFEHGQAPWGGSIEGVPHDTLEYSSFG